MGGTIRRVLTVAAAMVVPAIVVIAQPVGAPAVGAAGAFEALPAPQRLLDTRPGAATADGQFAG
ncbi:MAG: hypothetical protein ACRDZZ_15020, partial [Ilumatobacteraceae bacterium]